MKKIALLLIAMILCAACAFAAPEAADTPAYEMIEGVVLEYTENESCLIHSEIFGNVMVLISEETYIEANGNIEVGAYINVDFNGMMTRSLPPQINAAAIRMFRLEGSVSEILAEENAVMIETADMGSIRVNFAEGMQLPEAACAYLTVYTNGAMTMSLPPQTGASLVIHGYSIAGKVAEVRENMVVIGEGANAIEVHAEPALIGEEIVEGAVVRVIFNGQMTRSIPAQITAEMIVALN